MSAGRAPAPADPEATIDCPGESWDRARELAHAAPCALQPVRAVLADAAGSTLAEDLQARSPLPAFDTAAMDGYAVAGPAPYRPTGRLSAGMVPERRVLPGEAIAISTGAMVPDGTDAILRIEDVTLDRGLVFGPVPVAGSHIRRAGEDAQKGQVLAHSGETIAPVLLGLAAACGYDELLVRARPLVRVVVTGDELAHSGVSGAGLVRDALGPMLPHLIRALGGNLTELLQVGDRAGDGLAAALSPRSNQGADPSVIVVTGSTSVGVTDHLRPLLREAGARLLVDGVACRPGHPQLLATLGPSTWLVGLPGNPFAAVVAAHTLLAPLLAGLAGRDLPRLPVAELVGDVPTRPGRTVVVPVSWDGATARVLGNSRSASLQGAAQADALAVVPPDWSPNGNVRLILQRM